MTFWEWLDKRLRGPTERQWVTIALIATLWIMLQMAVDNPKLWGVKLFEILLQGVALTGFLNMVLAFHFAANKSDEVRAVVDEKRVDNTGKALDAITATAKAGGDTPDVVLKPGETAQAEEKKDA